MSAHEFIPLASAAARAYVALGQNDTQLDDGVLDVVAIALAACTPIYGALEPNAPLERLSDAAMAGGKFIRGAATLHFPSGAKPFTRLAVAAGDLAAGIERLKRAGVNFSQARFEHARRRVPRVTPG
jgi:hypothetical protein